MSSIVIAQGGGPTAVINQTLCGAIVAARRHDPSLRILGARHGVRGLTKGDLVDLTRLSETDLLRLAHTPNSGLGSTRDKPDAKYCESILSALQKVEARAFVYIGGNDTAGTLDILSKQSTGPCSFVHAPKTIDNDLMENDHVPGFISAAAFVANAFVSIDLDFRAMTGIYVGIVMGRHAGFLSAAAAGWQQSADDAPHLIYSPEKPFSVAQFLDDVDAVYTRTGHCIVSMSEGVQDETGRPLAEVLAAGTLEHDAHGNVQLSGGDLGIEIQRALKERFPKARTRVDTLGYLLRGYIGMIDETDAKEAFEAGAFAAQSAFTAGSGSVVLHYDGHRTAPRIVALDQVAGRTRHMPESFFAGSNAISAEGKRYFHRLLPKRPDIFTPFV